MKIYLENVLATLGLVVLGLVVLGLVFATVRFTLRLALDVFLAAPYIAALAVGVGLLSAIARGIAEALGG